MISEIVKNHNMANDLETQWLPLNIDGIGRQSKGMKVVSIQIYWFDVVGIFNGTIEIFVTNDQRSKSLSANYIVSSSSNIDNSILEELSSAFNYMKFKYSSNAIISGTLNAVISYEEKS